MSNNIFNKPKVFVIHGRDDNTRDRLELILHRIGAEPITLRKLPKIGAQTLIELLVENLPLADAVVVLMTPDDEGRLRNSDESLQPRARENVLVEAGYSVIAQREKTLLISIGNVSIPSDFGAIHRIDGSTFDKSIEIQLAKRLTDMGLNVHLSGAA